MPHFWNNIVVVTKDELVPSFFATWNTLKSEIQRYKDKSYGIKRLQSGGNGRQLLIAFDSLPIEIREALGDPRKLNHIMERFYTVDAEAVRFFSDYRFDDARALSDEHQELYITNACVLNAAIKLMAARRQERITKGGKTTGIMATICSDVASFNEVLKAKYQVQHNLPESEKRFKETFKSYQSEGYVVLVSQKLGKKNAQKVTDTVLEVLEAMFAKDSQKPTATEIHRRYSLFLAGSAKLINTDTGEEYNPSMFKELSQATVHNYLKSWKSKIATYGIRSGDRQKFMTAFKTPHSLEKPKYAGSIISVDDRQPPFKCLEIDGERIWFYNAIDLGSEAFTCWVHGKSKEGIIVDFYRQLVRNYHEWGLPMPHEIEAESALNSSFVDTFLKKGAMFQEVRIEANNARGKRIERYYGELRYRYEKQRTGWLARPFALSEANQAGPDKQPKLLYQTIVDGCLADIEEWNNSPHSVHTDKSRWQVFLENQHPKLKPTNWKGILPHLGFKTQTSCNAGQIRLNNKLFLLGNNGKVALGDELITLMSRCEGQDLDIYWLDGNDGEVIKALVYLRGGSTLMCEAVAKPRYARAVLEQTPDDLAQREIMSAYVATIEAYGRNKRNAIEQVIFIDESKRRFNDFSITGNNKPKATVSSERAAILPPPPDDDEVLVPAFPRITLFERF
ncbi:hypothetical protein SAMN05421780_101579 [Flexibacter flexilis DSM 6793]|uniref:Integrase catalytic domain-containing protein n=1 Tax=Flexibacter flexilis DSM 6793 TaxID=927664 RepID=A0A1I1E7W7_9BACT|nr:hypothetical protein [Flexibacter flexilis]SFB81043.1 hypothetical protein SAMN05421780_101579 [Flexibacter flexilis DSM 6793]